MSTISPDDTPPRPRNYRPGTGGDRYVRFVEDWLGLDVPETQRQILEALEEHRRVIVSAANGVGKSYSTAAGAIAALYCNPDTTVNITSGSYGQLDDTIWKPIKSLHRQSELPGRTLDNTRELRTEMDEEWFLKCLSPTYPADLEGRHNDRMVYVVEEADKPGITREHIDSAESTLTDEGDRLLVICNPPEDETNVVYELLESEKWHTIRVPSWVSRNVRVEAGEHPGPKIPGLVDLQEIRENWEDWNGEDWPGLEKARTAHKRRDDLDSRWYRRRAGVIPPEGAETWRPFHLPTVKRVFDDTIPAAKGGRPIGSGLDVARSGDRTVLITAYPNRLVVRDTWENTDYPQQEADVMEVLDEDPTHPLAVDAAGEGSGLADYLTDRWPETHRFRSDGEPPLSDADRTTETEYGSTNYRSQRAEGLAALGDWLEDAPSGAITDHDLRTELLAGARTIAFSERHLASRGEDGEDVVEVNSKDAVKQYLDHSPDYLDASTLAIWAAKCSPETITSDNAIVF